MPGPLGLSTIGTYLGTPATEFRADSCCVCHTLRSPPPLHSDLKITVQRLCLASFPILVLLGFARDSAAASFDCSKAKARLDRLICANASLSRLDENLSLEYRKALTRVPDAAQLKSEQRTWLKSRNSCQDTACLEQAYRSRIAALHPSPDSTPAPAPQKPASALPYQGQGDPEVGQNENGAPTFVVSASIQGHDQTRLSTDKGDFYFAPWLSDLRLSALQSMAEGLRGQRARITYSKSETKDSGSPCWVEAIARNIGFLEKRGKE